METVEQPRFMKPIEVADLKFAWRVNTPEGQQKLETTACAAEEAAHEVLECAHIDPENLRKPVGLPTLIDRALDDEEIAHLATSSLAQR